MASAQNKRALLVGINYVGTENELQGCINDVHNMADALVTYFGYAREHITILTDNTAVLPTRANILSHLRALCSTPGLTHAFLHYSGHGSYVRDSNRDESDGRDECLVPLDFTAAGMILDDELFALINGSLLATTRLTCVSDSCHSGTVFDLPFRYQQTSGGRYVRTENLNRSNLLDSRVVVAFSGCSDAQTSADAFLGGQYCGALTAAFLNLLAANNGGGDLTLGQVQVGLNAFLAARRFSQRSLLTVSSGTNKACGVKSKLVL